MIQQIRIYVNELFADAPQTKSRRTQGRGVLQPD